MRRALHLALLLCAAAVPARAQDASPEPTPLPAYELNLPADISITVAAFAASLVWQLGPSEPAYCAPLCDPRDVNPLDRPSAGNYDEGYHLVSNLALLGLLAGSATTLLVDGSFMHALNDGLVIAESAMVSLALMATINVASRRPRPYLYSEAASLQDRLEPWAALSFPSGHSATAAAVTTATFYTMLRRHPRSPAPWIVLTVGSLITGLVVAGRIAGGDHFPTDTAVGVAIGASLGIAIPALHADPRDSYQAALLPSVGPGHASLTYRAPF